MSSLFISVTVTKKGYCACFSGSLTNLNYIIISGFRDCGKCCMEGKAVRCSWSGSESESLTEV